MAYYMSDLRPTIMRVVEALDRGESMSFHELRERLGESTLHQVLNQLGSCPMPILAVADREEIASKVIQILDDNIGNENEHFYVSNNGYCLLIAAFVELSRDVTGAVRPVGA